MDDEGHVTSAPPRGRLTVLLAMGFAAGTAIAGIAIFSAEFGIDPTGLGRLTGLNLLAGPKEAALTLNGSGGSAAWYSDIPFRTDTVEIPLKRAGTFGADEVEWKVRMKAGATMIYSWSVPEIEDPEEFYYSFHGQTEPGADGGGDITVTTYREETGSSGAGSLTAPFDGLQGWYLNNQSARAVVVRITLAGFYEIATQDDIAAAAAAAARPVSE